MGARGKISGIFIFWRVCFILCFSFVYLNSAWAILLDRSQTRLQIVLISPELFIPVEDDAMERQRLIESVPDSVTPLIIYEETTDIWINVCMFSCTWFEYFLRMLKQMKLDSKLSKWIFWVQSNLECYLLSLNIFRLECWFQNG